MKLDKHTCCCLAHFTANLAMCPTNHMDLPNFGFHYNKVWSHNFEKKNARKSVKNIIKHNKLLGLNRIKETVNFCQIILSLQTKFLLFIFISPICTEARLALFFITPRPQTCQRSQCVQSPK